MTSTGTSASTRTRIIAAAKDMTCESGWSSVTMARLAERIDVSRQTVYNEIGTKSALAESMILTELDGFLAVVDQAFDAEPDDVVAAIGRACRDVLVMAQDNPLLRAVVSASHGADTELLPLLTTHSEALVETAKQVIAARVDDYDICLEPDRLAAGIDVVVRVVLSHMMRPSATAESTADDISWISSRVLRAG